MNGAILTLLLVMSLSAEITAQSSSPATRHLNPGYVKDGDIGCGCAFALNPADLRKRRYIYIQGMDEPAYVNLNGKNLKLRPVTSSETKVKEKVGDRSWATYIAGDIKIRMDYVVTRVCDPNDESCEATWYKAIMTVTRKTERTIVRLTGSCGC